MNRLFSAIAHHAAHVLGRSYTFVFSCMILITWGMLGPWAAYSDTWQLVANTATSLATFLIVILLQNSLTRDTLEINIKLDELIRANKLAHNSLMNLERHTERQLQDMKDVYDQQAAIDEERADKETP